MSVKFDFKALEKGFEADWPVTVKVPTDGGTFEERTFMARFKTLTPAEQKEVDGVEKPLDRVLKVLELGWLGLAESEGETLTAVLREELLNQPNVAKALIDAMTQFRTGGIRGN